MSVTNDDALALLKSAGDRATTQRKAVIGALREAGIPVSVEMVFKHVNEKFRKIDLVTVYRILDRLEEVGAAVRTFGPDGIAMFYLRGDRRRYFAVSRSDGAAIEIDRDCAAMLERSALEMEALLAKKGYRELSHVVQFYVDSNPAVDATTGSQVPTPAEKRFDTLRSIAEALREDLPSIASHPAFIALQRRAGRAKK